MGPILKALLLLEVVALFGYGILSLITGVIAAIYLAPAYFSRSFPDVEIGAGLMMVVLAGGVLGMIAVISLVIKIMRPTARVLSPGKIKIFAICGVLSILGFTWWLFRGLIFTYGAHLIPIMFLLLPVIGIIHLAYLARSYLFEIAANKRLQFDAAKPRD